MSTTNPYGTPSAQPSYAAQRTFTLKNLDVMSCGIMLATLYAILGLIVGGFITLISLMGAAIAADGNALMGSLLFGVGSIIIMPIMYGVGGFVGGIIVALLYNVCASFVGGIKFDLE